MATTTVSPPRRDGDGNQPHLTAVTPTEDVRTVMLNRVSWGAVLAGAAVAILTQILLNMLGVGIGLATLDPGTNDNPSATTFSIAGALWFILSGVIGAGTGGFIAGRASGQPTESSASMHGLISWAAATLVVIYLLGSALGSVASGTMGALSSVVGGLGRTAATAAQTAAPALANVADPFGGIERQVREASGGNDPAALRDAAVSAVRGVLTGDAAQAQEGRERAAQALARAQNVPVEQARAQVAQYEQQYRQAADAAKRRATEAADATAKVASRGALFSFVGLLLGALAGWSGGRMGRVQPIVTSAQAGFGGRG